MSASPDLVVTMTREELRAMIREELAELAPAAEPPRAAIDTVTLGRAIGVSRPTISRLVDEGMPTLRVGDHARYVLADVLAWLRKRSSSAADEAAE